MNYAEIIKSNAAAADLLWEGQERFSAAIVLIEEMGRTGHSLVRDNADIADKIVIEGPELAKELRGLALQLDRCVHLRGHVVH